MANSYLDKDGLLRQYGTAKAVPEIAGEYRTTGDERVIEFELDLTTLTSSPVIISNTLRFPSANMFIKDVEVMARVAATSSGSGTIDIGLQKADRTTELDYNGLVAAMPKGNVDSVGEINTFTSTTGTYGGALLGTTLTDVGSYLTANYNTAAYQTGIVRVKVRFVGYGTITN